VGTAGGGNLLPGEGEEERSTTAALSGTAGNAVVAGAISGGIHFGESGHREARPRQLPRPIGTFVNRIRDLEDLQQMTARTPNGEFENSIVLVTGTAGVGKTALAVQWAHANSALFPDGQIHLNLRGFDPAEPVEPLDALARMLASLGVPERAIPNDLEAAAAEFRTRVADRRMLLILDNVRTANQARPLLPATARCLTLITSRDSLSGLVSQEGARRLDLKLFTSGDAVLLLRTILGRFRADDDEQSLDELADLCSRLPLALRVAAERAIERPRDSLIELITELRGESLLWDALSAADEEQADAIRSVFTWSYRALTTSAARMFRLLGLHPGQEISTGAAAALAGVTPSQARTQLSRLANAHMVQVVARDRYQFHDLLRAYAESQVRSDPESERAAAIEREAAWYTYSAASAAAVVHPLPLPLRVMLDPLPPGCEPATFTSRDAAIEWYAAERASLRSISASAGRHGMRRWSWQLAIVLIPIHHATRSSFRDWLVTSGYALSAARADGEPQAVASLLHIRGVTLTEQSPRRLDDAARDLDEALTIWRDLGDLAGEAGTLNSLGWIALRRRRLTEAVSIFGRLGALADQMPPSRWRAVAPENACVAYYESGDLETAASLGTRALTMLEQLAMQNDGNVDPRLEFDTLTWLARVQRERGLLTEASALAARMMDITRGQGFQPGYLMVARLEQGRISLATGNAAEALAAMLDSANASRAVADRAWEAAALDGTADAYQALARHTEAHDFYRAAAVGFIEAEEPWRAASSLAKLADSLDVIGRVDDATAQRRSATDLIAPYDDPYCAELRARLTDSTGA
jgi:tetratricopeptide (TPR) repeat protein